MISLIFGIFACDSSGDYDFNDVYIRLDNKTGIDLDRATLGRRLNKRSGLKHIEFSTVFENVKNNEVTDYVNTKGQFNGYSNVVIHYPEGQRVQDRENLNQQLKANNAFEDTFENPFANSTNNGLSLPKGNYTFRLTLHENKNLINIEILEDKEI